MKKFLSILFIGSVCFLFSCGPSEQQQAEGEEAATESVENMTTPEPTPEATPAPADTMAADTTQHE